MPEKAVFKAHDARVRQIASVIKDFYEKRQKFRINHGSTNSTRNQHLKDRKNTVDTSKLDQIIEVDPVRKLAVIEPNVPMDRLIEATLAHNCIPPVVMDFPGITAGGGYAGSAGESSSFKYGWFDRTVTRLEIVLANGEIVECSSTQNSDLFLGAAGAMGTLGVIVLLEISLVEAAKYVETTYHPVSTFQEGVDKCEQFTSSHSDFDYVDGIMFSEKSGTIITAKRTDIVPRGHSVQRFSASKDPWFVWHVQNQVNRSTTPLTEFIPLPEYLFRYDRGGFWVGETALSILPFSGNAGGRWRAIWRRLLDSAMHTRMLYAMMRSHPFNAMIIQDLAVPYQATPEFLQWAAENIQIWPLWLCPLKQSPMPTLHPHNDSKDRADCFFEDNIAIEAKLRSTGGMKWMYGTNLETEEQFWSQHDREWYNQLRTKYHSDWLPDIFEKATTSRSSMETYLKSLRLKDYWYLIFPGKTISYYWAGWRSNEWKWKKESTWMRWVPKGSEHQELHEAKQSTSASSPNRSIAAEIAK